MRVLFLLISFPLLEVCAQPFNYPASGKSAVAETYHGVRVEDPYRWLEDDYSEETKAWVQDQNKFTQAYLEQIPLRDSLREVMKKNWSFVRFQAPFRCGNNGYFYYRHDGLQAQPVLFYMKSLEFVPFSWFDPNKLSEKGTTAITQTVPSPDGRYMAFQVSESGSDWTTIRVKEVKTQKTLPDVISRCKFSNIAWFKEGFYYSRYDGETSGHEGYSKHRIYYHQLNTPQEKDRLIWSDPDFPKRNFTASVTEDQRFLVISGSESTAGNSLYIIDLLKGDQQAVSVVKGFEHDFDLIGNYGERLYFLTNHKAPRKKIISIDIRNPDPAAWKDVIPEQQEILQSAVFSWQNIVCHYMKSACSRLYVYTMEGKKTHDIPLDGIGSVDALSGSTADSMLFFSFATFTAPSTVYRYNVKSARMGVQFRSPLPYDPAAFETRQVFYTSKDGTRIPMFLVHKKGYKPDGETPTLLFGYGGFNISKTPEYKSERMVFLQKGGLFAMPNLRGGGEFGTDWHRDGTVLKKQNVFDDFIAAAEYLIKEGYTVSEKLAISGRSNGGLLVGAAMTQRPDLFRVALPAVGVMDMLRFQRFTIGWAWVTDYGCSDDPAQFKALYAYSPLHNLKEGTRYPATLITTADHDDRVVPGHSFKFTARLQEVQSGPLPALIRVDTDAGHGAGKPTGKLLEEQTDIFTFLFHHLGMRL